MKVWRIAGRHFDDPPPADWRQRLASRLGERPRRVGPWVELALYGALRCLDDAGETRLPDAALLSLCTLHVPDIALRAALAEARDGLPLPIGFLTSQPGQVLPALARYLDWHGEGRCLSSRAPALALQLACVEAGPAGLLAGWVDEDEALAQALVIAGLVALIFKELELSVLFLMAISAVWFGANNAAKEIVGELPIYRRERMFNLKIMPYLLSKVLVLSFFSLLQVLAFVGIVFLAVGNEAVQMNHYWGYVGVMFYLTFSATLLGLLVSAIVNNAEKVMTIIPIVLIPQIILSGVITAIPEETPAEVVSYGMLSRWGTGSFAYVQDSIRSYMADPLHPGELVYQTVDAVDFLNLPSAYIHKVINLLPDNLALPQALAANLWNNTVINLLIFIALFVAMKRKDSV